MTMLEVFKLMGAEDFEHYGRAFFACRDKKEALRDLKSDLPKKVEKSLRAVLEKS